MILLLFFDHIFSQTNELNDIEINQIKIEQPIGKDYQDQNQQFISNDLVQNNYISEEELKIMQNNILNKESKQSSIHTVQLNALVPRPIDSTPNSESVSNSNYFTRNIQLKVSLFKVTKGKTNLKNVRFLQLKVNIEFNSRSTTFIPLKPTQISKLYGICKQKLINSIQNFKNN